MRIFLNPIFVVIVACCICLSAFGKIENSSVKTEGVWQKSKIAGNSTYLQDGASHLPESNAEVIFKLPTDAKAKKLKSLERVFLEGLFAGFLAVFTPYVYSILPITVTYISIISKNKRRGFYNSILYALALVVIFTSLGAIISLFADAKFFILIVNHWIFSLLVCRIFFGLGLSFLGAFEINLPLRWSRLVSLKSNLKTLKGIFYLALSMPMITISSTGPIICLVLVFSAKGGIIGPIIGMLGFSIGFGLPFVFPKILNIISNNVNWLNHIKVLLGFFSLYIGLRFLANVDVSLGWNILDREMFVILWMLLSIMMGVYMMGYVHLTNDYQHNRNVFGQEYITFTRLALCIAFFSFAVYLLPGIWGAPLYRVSNFLPTLQK